MLMWAQRHSRDNYTMFFGVAGLEVASEVGGLARIVQNPDLGYQRQLIERIGSSGRIRTYNPPVNSRMLCR